MAFLPNTTKVSGQAACSLCGGAGDDRTLAWPPASVAAFMIAKLATEPSAKTTAVSQPIRVVPNGFADSAARQFPHGDKSGIKAMASRKIGGGGQL